MGLEIPRVVDKLGKKNELGLKTTLECFFERSGCAGSISSILLWNIYAAVDPTTPPELWDRSVWMSNVDRLQIRNWIQNIKNDEKSRKLDSFFKISGVILAVRCSYSPRMFHARSPPILRVWTSSEHYFSSKITFFNLKTHQNQPNSKIPLYPISKYQQWNSENPDLWSLIFLDDRGWRGGWVV